MEQLNKIGDAIVELAKKVKDSDAAKVVIGLGGFISVIKIVIVVLGSLDKNQQS